MDLTKRIILALTATPVAKFKDSKVQVEYGMKVVVDFAESSISILRVGRRLEELLPLKVLCPAEKEYFIVKERTPKKIVIGLKKDYEGFDQGLWALEDVVEFILAGEDGFSVIGIEFITEKRLPFKPLNCKKK